MMKNKQLLLYIYYVTRQPHMICDCWKSFTFNLLGWILCLPHYLTSTFHWAAMLIGFMVENKSFSRSQPRMMLTKWYHVKVSMFSVYLIVTFSVLCALWYYLIIMQQFIKCPEVWNYAVFYWFKLRQNEHITFLICCHSLFNILGGLGWYSPENVHLVLIF